MIKSWLFLSLRIFIYMQITIYVIMPAVYNFWPSAEPIDVLHAQVGEIDSRTGLPLLDHTLHLEHLPDGHYSVAATYWRNNRAIVVQHKPGPDRNFAYYTMDCHSDRDLQVGDRFTVHDRQVI